MATKIAYYLNGEEVLRPKSLVIDGNTYVPPTNAELIEYGYEIREVEMPTPTPYLHTYSELVEQYMSDRYTTGAEIALINNYLLDNEKYSDAYAEYQRVRIEAKEWAEQQPHRED